MQTLFDVLKWIFFFLTVMVALFFLRGDVVIWAQYYPIVKQIIMPGYLLFCGIMLGYIIAHLRSGNREDNPQKNKIFVNSFMIGLGIWLFFAITYMII